MLKSERLRELREGKLLQAVTLEPEEESKKTGKLGKKNSAVKASKPPVTLEQWFLDRRKEMTGVCECGCGKPSSKKDDQWFKSSIAHILPKSKVKSVATHPLNWIEMNHWDGCHTNMDNKGSDLWPNMACWDIIVQRFLLMYPSINPKERRHIPQVLQKLVP